VAATFAGSPRFSKKYVGARIVCGTEAARSPPLDGGLAVEVRHAGLAVGACHQGEDQPRDLDFAGGGDERFALADLVTRPGGERLVTA
jgi:hypothetical protein